MIVNNVKAFFCWQREYLLGEKSIKFISIDNKINLVLKLNSKVDKAVFSYIIPKLVSKNDFFGSIKDDQIIIKRRINILLRQVISIPYYYKAALIELRNKCYIEGEYKMYLFLKIFFLSFINAVFINFCIATFLTIKELYFFLTSGTEMDKVINVVYELLGSFLFLFVVFYFIRFHRWLGKINLKKLYSFFESLNIREST